MTVFFNNEYLPKPAVHISPDDRAFLFADGVYDVARTYNGHLFHIGAHLNRLDRSLRELRISTPGIGFERVCKRLLEENSLDHSEACVYIQVSRGAAPRQHAYRDLYAPYL